MQKVDIFKPTEKQLKFIRRIESVNGVKFTGQTRWDASDFISKHKNWFFMKVNMASELRFLSRQLCQMLSYVNIDDDNGYADFPPDFIDDILG